MIRFCSGALVILCALSVGGCEEERPPGPGLDSSAPPADSGVPEDSTPGDSGTVGPDGTVPPIDAGPVDRTCAFSEAVIFPLATAQVWITDAPAVAADNDGAIVGWVSLVDGMPRVSTMKVPADPDDSLGVLVVTAAASRQRAPAVAALNEGFMVTWRDDDDGDFEIMARIIDAAGEPVDPILMLTDNAVDDGPPSVGVNSTGRGMVGWVEDPDGTPAGRLQMLTPDGSPSGGTRTSEDFAASKGQPVIEAVGTSFGLGYVDSAGTVQLRLFDDVGAPVGPAVPISGEPNAPGILSLATGPDGSGAALYDARAGGIRPELRMRTFDADGQPFGTETIITPVPTVGQSSALAPIGAGYTVAYRGAPTDGADTGLDIGLLNWDASAAGERVRLAPTVAPATFTAVSASPDGRRIYVAWTDDSRMQVARILCE